MGYPWQPGLMRGPGWRLAGVLQQLGDQFDPIAKARGVPDWCLGTRGDGPHAAQAGYSDHNDIVVAPDGLRLVRAIDIEDSVADIVDAAFARLYAAKHPAVYPLGYVHRDGLITIWYGDGSKRSLPGDEGHLHASVNQTVYPSIPGGYVPALDAPINWFGGAVPLGSGTPVSQEDDMYDDAARAQAKETHDAVAELDRLLGPAGESTGKLDKILQGVTDIRGGMEGLPALFAALRSSGGAPLAVDALSTALASDLGPDLGKQLVAALGQKLA